MFKCLVCEKIDSFSLLLSSNYTGPGIFKMSYNQHKEILLDIDGYQFIPDLGFMNSHAVCKFCGSINNFEYHFENSQTNDSDSSEPENYNVDINKK